MIDPHTVQMVTQYADFAHGSGSMLPFVWDALRNDLPHLVTNCLYLSSPAMVLAGVEGLCKLVTSPSLLDPEHPGIQNTASDLVSADDEQEGLYSRMVND